MEARKQLPKLSLEIQSEGRLTKDLVKGTLTLELYVDGTCFHTEEIKPGHYYFNFFNELFSPKIKEPTLD